MSKKLIFGILAALMMSVAHNAMAKCTSMTYWANIDPAGTVDSSFAPFGMDVWHRGTGNYRVQFFDYFGDNVRPENCTAQVTVTGDSDAVSGMNGVALGTVGFQNGAAPRFDVKTYRYNTAKNHEYRNFAPRNEFFSLVLHCGCGVPD